MNGDTGPTIQGGKHSVRRELFITNTLIVTYPHFDIIMASMVK